MMMMMIIIIIIMMEEGSGEIRARTRIRLGGKKRTKEVGQVR